jgi:hypothetical protein
VPRVLGVPFRRPVLVAKAAESLQRLSRGRLILGLGAGYRDAEIRAAGGPDLTPRGKVDGLEDAIAITRAAWTQSDVSYQGAVYSVDDLDLEPKPATPIPIWLGALGVPAQRVSSWRRSSAPTENGGAAACERLACATIASRIDESQAGGLASSSGRLSPCFPDD